MRNFRKRFGSYLIIIGMVLIVFFFLSDYLEQVEGWYLLIGALLFGVGASLAWRGGDAPEPSSRFRLLRRMSGDGKNSRRSRRGRGAGRADKDEEDER